MPRPLLAEGEERHSLPLDRAVAVTPGTIDAMHIIEAVPLLLGILSGFVTGIMAGLGIAVIRSARTDFALATLDRMLVVLSLVAAFGLGVFVSLALR